MVGKKQCDSERGAIYVYGESEYIKKRIIIPTSKVFRKKIWKKFLGLRYEYKI